MKRRRKEQMSPTDTWDLKSLGVDAERYQAVLQYLFDRAEPLSQQQDWYWEDEHQSFEATPLEWTRFQTAIFAHSGIELSGYSDEQVGMGLNYLMDGGISDVPFAAINESVPLFESMRMMRAMSLLWQQCIGPRLSSVHQPIGSAQGRLGSVCYMWFDEWPTLTIVSRQAPWRDAVWKVLTDMLATPCREVNIAALHGIGHIGEQLDRRLDIDQMVTKFVIDLNGSDEELEHYADAALRGNVQ